MTDGAQQLPSPRLHGLIQRSAGSPTAAGGSPSAAVGATSPAAGVTGPDAERCELCSEPVPAEHRHVVDKSSRELQCACRACSLLFDHRAAGGGRYALIPDRCDTLDGFQLDDLAWNSLGIPVGMAFFVRREDSGRVAGYYPSPAGPTESLLELETWAELECDNPVLRDMRPDVEALLVNRMNEAREHWIVGVDECYRLVAVVRSHWRGLHGGTAVWTEIERFFDGLRARAKGRR